MGAASFTVARCACWSHVFDSELVAWLASVSDRCLRAASRDPVFLERLAAANASRHQDEMHQRHAVQHGSAPTEGAVSSPDPVRLYVGVLSSSAGADRRAAIRETWGRHPAVHTLRFFLARPASDDRFQQLESESRTYRDLVILEGVRESYFNISYQTLEIFRQSAGRAGVTHVLKADDDTYVRVEALLGAIAPRRAAAHLFLGWVENPGGGPHRDRGSRWFISTDEWLGERYPPWAHGAGYVLGAELAAEVGRRIAPTRLFKLEDVAVGDWVERVAAERGWRVDYATDTRFNFDGCHRGDVLSHYVTALGQRCLHSHAGACSACRGRKHRGRPH